MHRPELCARGADGILYPLAKGTISPNKLLNKRTYIVPVDAFGKLLPDDQTYVLCIRKAGVGHSDEVFDLYGRCAWSKRVVSDERRYLIARNAKGLLELKVCT